MLKKYHNQLYIIYKNLHERKNIIPKHLLTLLFMYVLQTFI